MQQDLPLLPVGAWIVVFNGRRFDARPAPATANAHPHHYLPEDIARNVAQTLTATLCRGTC